VRGTRGFLSGAVHVLQVGESMTIGRSRSADLSMRRAERLYERDDWGIVMNSEPFLSVSRHHVRIHFLHRDLVEIKDMSSNGTMLDGRRIDCVAVTDLDERPHTLRLGTREMFSIEIVAETRAESGS
jgi:pSer/pThr/pTyr-binding forkhead associated (FHA) protein